MPVYKTPDNLVELLNGVVRSASRTAFYRPRLSGVTEIASLEEFRAIPPTPLSVFRDRALRYTLAEPSNVDWIVGADGGQSPARAAMAESADEGAIRYDILADAVKEHIRPRRLDRLRGRLDPSAPVLSLGGRHDSDRRRHARPRLHGQGDDLALMNASSCWNQRSWLCSHPTCRKTVCLKRPSWQ